jgi:hypothetical protein
MLARAEAVEGRAPSSRETPTNGTRILDMSRGEEVTITSDGIAI